MKKLLTNPIAPFLIILLFGIYIIMSFDPDFLFAGDSLSKLIQADSILKNNFSSEELFYPARDIDPDFKYYPFPSPFYIQVGESHLGQYPVFFSIISAVIIKLFTTKALPFIGLSLFLASLFILKKFYNVRNSLIYFGGFCTYLLVFSIDFSENIYTFTLTFLGLTLYFSEIETQSVKIPKSIFAGILIGLGVWLRLEGLFFFFALSIGYLLVFGFKNKTELTRFILFGIGFSVLVFGFILFNYLDYGHILGPRYLANKEGFYQGLSDKIIQMTTLIFAWNIKIGYFVFTPVFLYTIIKLIIPSNYQKLENRYKLLLIAILVFIPLVAFFAPNDGAVNWGPRYLAHAVFPNLILFSVVLEKFEAPSVSLTKKTFLYISCAISFLFFFTGFKFFEVGAKQLKKFQTEMEAVKTDIRVFQNFYLANHMGSSYLKNSSVLITEEKALQEFIDKVLTLKKGKTLGFYHSDFQYAKNSSMVSEEMKTLEKGKEFYLRILGEKLKFIKKHEQKHVTVYEYKIE